MVRNIRALAVGIASTGFLVAAQASDLKPNVAAPMDKNLTFSRESRTNPGELTPIEKFIRQGGGIKKHGFRLNPTAPKNGPMNPQNAEMCELFPDDYGCGGDEWLRNPEAWEFGTTYTSTGATIGFAVSTLPGVEVEGLATNVIYCIDSSCWNSEFFYEVNWPALQGNGALPQNFMKHFMPEVKAVACTIPSTAGPNARSVTSLGDDYDRLAAANEILQYLIQGPVFRFAMDGEDVNVVFSDGGTETYTFVAMASNNVRKQPSDLVRGDGVSKCP